MGGRPEAHVNPAMLKREARVVAQPGVLQEFRCETVLGLLLGPRRQAGTSSKSAPPEPSFPKLERQPSPRNRVWAEPEVKAPRGDDQCKAHPVTTRWRAAHPEDVASMPGWKRLQRHDENKHNKKKEKALQPAAAAKLAGGGHVETSGLQELPRLNGRPAVVSAVLAPATLGPRQAAAVPDWPLLRLKPKCGSQAKLPTTILSDGHSVVPGVAKAKASLWMKPTVQMGLEQPQLVVRPAEQRRFAPPPPRMIPPPLPIVEERITDIGKLLPKAVPP
jgi:hypothetical protein